MPTPDFDLDVESMGVSLKTLQQLSRLYEVSLEAAALRMIRTGLSPMAMIVLAYSHKPKEIKKIESEKNQLKLWNDSPLEQPPMKLRAQYFFRTKNFSSSLSTLNVWV